MKSIRKKRRLFRSQPCHNSSVSDWFLIWLCKYTCKITWSSKSWELNIVATCGLDHFIAVVTVQVTYISDYKIRSRQLQYSTTPGYSCKITWVSVAWELKVIATCSWNHLVAINIVRVTYIPDWTFSHVNCSLDWAEAGLQSTPV